MDDKTPFERINKGLKKYYERLGRKDYENKEGEGKFLAYVKSEGLAASDIEDEFEGNPSDCIYLDFDDNFPFANEITNETEKQKIMFDIIRKCYKRPSKSKWNMELTNDEYKHFKEIYLKHCPQTAKTKIDDHTFWLGLCLSFTNNFPFLQFLSQIYVRENIQHMLKNSKSVYDLNTFMTNHKDAFMKLSAPHKSVTILNNEEKEQSIPVIDFIQSAINLYFSRLLPTLRLPIPPFFGKIDDDIDDIARAISGVSTFCQRNELPCPFQMDCVIACNVTEEMSDSEDDEKEKDKCLDSVGDILIKLKENKCEYYIHHQKDPIFRPKRISTIFNEFKTKMKNKYNNIDAKYMNNYPQRRRMIIFIDKRKNINVLNNGKIQSKKNTNINSITFFESRSDVREYPNYKQNTNSADISEWCIEATRTCIIPGIKKDKMKHNLLKTKNAVTERYGHLITFSFHVEQQNRIRCYMWWRGKCILFLPQDINDILPDIFKNSDGFKFDGYDVCSWRDETFEAVYQNVTHKDPIQELRKHQK